VVRFNRGEREEPQFPTSQVGTEPAGDCNLKI
jgi:hypothetical protein